VTALGRHLWMVRSGTTVLHTFAGCGVPTWSPLRSHWPIAFSVCPAVSRWAARWSVICVSQTTGAVGCQVGPGPDLVGSRGEHDWTTRAPRGS